MYDGLSAVVDGVRSVANNGSGQTMLTDPRPELVRQAVVRSSADLRSAVQEVRDRATKGKPGRGRKSRTSRCNRAVEAAETLLTQALIHTPREELPDLVLIQMAKGGLVDDSHHHRTFLKAADRAVPGSKAQKALSAIAAKHAPATSSATLATATTSV